MTARVAYVHEAHLAMGAGADLAAPGGAVTAALCGTFAVEPAAEGEVRSRVDRALAAGFCDGPDGRRSRWTLRRSEPGVIAAGEREHAARLIGD